MNPWDIIVIGAGAIGSATCFFLQKENPSLNTLLVEGREEFGRGTTGAWGSLIRVFSSTPGVSEKALETVPFFLDFQKHVGSSCRYSQTGSLYFFTKGSESKVLPRYEDLKSKSTTPLLLLNAKLGRVQFPEFQWLDEDFAIYEPQAGFACPMATTSAWIGQARQNGLTVRTQTSIVRMIPDATYSNTNPILKLETHTGEILFAKYVILCGGPWSAKLLRQLDLSLPATPVAIQVNRFHTKTMPQNLPFFLDYEEWTFARTENNGLLHGGYCTEIESGLNSFRQPLSLKEAVEAKKKLSKRLKSLRTATLLGGIRAVEMYTNNSEPILGFDTQHSNLYLATGWNCSGFVLSPYYGKKIALDVLKQFEKNKNDSTF